MELKAAPRTITSRIAAIGGRPVLLQALSCLLLPMGSLPVPLSPAPSLPAAQPRLRLCTPSAPWPSHHPSHLEDGSSPSAPGLNVLGLPSQLGLRTASNDLCTQEAPSRQGSALQGLSLSLVYELSTLYQEAPSAVGGPLLLCLTAHVAWVRRTFSSSRRPQLLSITQTAPRERPTLADEGLRLLSIL